MHYTSLRLTNFRGFCETPPIPLAPLTFLVGPNSSGKSSIFDALLLVAQSGFAPSAPTVRSPNWQGSLVDLGSYKDAVYRHEVDRKIDIVTEVAWDGNETNYFSPRAPAAGARALFSFQLTSSGRSDPIGRLAELAVTDEKTGQDIIFAHAANDPTKTTIEFLGKRRVRRIDPLPSSIFYFRRGVEEFVQQVGRNRGFRGRIPFQSLLFFSTTPVFLQFSSQTQRISSGRLGPKRWYSATGVKPTRAIRGLYEGIDPQMIEEVLRQGRSETKKATVRQRQQIGRFLKDLEIANAVTDVKLSPYHTAIKVRDSVTKIVSNLIDVGYGASQVLPVLLGCLSRSTSPLLVEQPEIHLHPRAQGTVAELLCSTSKNRQVIIETHSEHMINRARILIGQGTLKPEEVIINYITRRKEGSIVEPITILKSGEFGKPWPAGFFDERYQDTMLLLDIKNKAYKPSKHKKR